MEPKNYQTRDEGAHGRTHFSVSFVNVYRVAPGRTVTYGGTVIPAGTEVAQEMVTLPEFVGRVIVESRVAAPDVLSPGVKTRHEAVAGEDE